MSISVILPAYKEAENLNLLLPTLKTELKALQIPYEILVIDSLFPLDATQEICQKFSVQYINRNAGNTYGDAVRTGIACAKMHTIVFMDSDGSHNPSDIKHMYTTIQEENADIIIGSRYMKGGNTHNSAILIAMSRVLNFTYSVFFQLPVQDVSNSYRMYRAEKLKSINLECEDFDIVEEILIALTTKYKNLIIKEIPVTFSKRVYGKSKRELVKFIFSYLKTMHKLLKIKRNI